VDFFQYKYRRSTDAFKPNLWFVYKEIVGNLSSSECIAECFSPEECIAVINLKKLLDGSLKPSKVIGTGYKNAKATASAWLRKELHNMQNPNVKVDEVFVAPNGKGFESESHAMRTTRYRALINGNYGTADDKIVTDYGVMPAIGGDGYMAYVCF